MPEVNPSSSFPQRSLGELVTENTRAAAVFERFGLDYCCHGHQTLEDAAREQGVPIDQVVAALESLGAPTTGDRADEAASLDQLTQLIVQRHHRYVRESTPTINAWLDKLVSRHGERHPELAQARDIFRQLGAEMAAHMAKEENILFPFIDALAAAERDGHRPAASPFGTIVNPVRVMEADHAVAGDLLARLRTLTGGYEPPADACTTYRLCYSELARFEADLHRHVHLENNVLFPRALELEHTLV
jgi:regulator of cell morphogenesis and NO signaling